MAIADDEADPPTDVMRRGGRKPAADEPGHLEVASSGAHYSRALDRPAQRPDRLAAERRRRGRPASFRGHGRAGNGEAWSRTDHGAEVIIPTGEIAALGSGPIRFEVVEQGGVPSRPARLTFNP